MARSDIQAGRAYVELLLKDRSFARGIAAASAKLRSFGKGVAIFSAAVGGAALAVGASIFGVVKKFSDIGSALYDMSQRTHDSVEALSLFEYAADQTGTSLSLIEKAIHKARKEGKSFEEMAAQIAAIQDPAMQSQKAIELFGLKLGPALVPLLNDLPALQKRFEELGLTISTEQAAAADVFGDAMTDLQYVIRSFVVSLGSTLAPAITNIVNYISESLVSLRKWLSEINNGIINALAAGDLLLATKVTWATIKTMWLEGTNTIRQYWRDFAFGAIDIWNETANGIKVIWTEVIASIKTKFTEAQAFFQRQGAAFGLALEVIFGETSLAQAKKDYAAVAGIFDKISKSRKQQIQDEKDSKLAAIVDERKAAIAAVADAKAASDKVSSDALENAKKELAALREQAKQKREGLKAGKVPKFELPDAGVIKSQIFGSFSAAALLAAGAGGSPEVKQLSELRREERERHRELMRQLGRGGRLK